MAAELGREPRRLMTAEPPPAADPVRELLADPERADIAARRWGYGMSASSSSSSSLALPWGTPAGGAEGGGVRLIKEGRRRYAKHVALVIVLAGLQGGAAIP